METFLIALVLFLTGIFVLVFDIARRITEDYMDRTFINGLIFWITGADFLYLLNLLGSLR